GVVVLDRINTGHRGPHITFKVHQLVGLQPPNSLSHWYYRHAQFRGNRGEHQSVARLIPAGSDPLEYVLVSLIGFGETAGFHLLALFCAVGLVLGFPLTRWWEQSVNGGTVLDLFLDPLVLLLLFEGFVDHFDQQIWRNNNHTVVLSAAAVIGLHGGATARDRAVHFPWDVTTTEHSRVVPIRVHRNVNVYNSCRIAHATVGDNRVGATNLGTHG